MFELPASQLAAARYPAYFCANTAGLECVQGRTSLHAYISIAYAVSAERPRGFFIFALCQAIPVTVSTELPYNLLA